jgi:hypothetical protein
MGCLGVLFSLDEKEVSVLKALKSDQERLDHLQETIETVYFEKFPERIAELDSSWDALHRSLTNGKLEYSNGTFPLSHVILGGEILYHKSDYIMTLKDPEVVAVIAQSIIGIDERILRAGYEGIDVDDYGSPLTDEDLQFTWDWFDGSKDFWQRAAMEKRYVLFTADQ